MSVPVEEIKTCRHGHPCTPENTKVLVTGTKVCIPCRRARSKAQQQQYKKPSDFRHYNR